MKTLCIVGLGNPGKKYKNTYHNIGFKIIDGFLNSHNPEGKLLFSKKHNAEIAEIFFEETRIILVKPQTFMNKSGYSVKSILDFFKVSAQEGLLVIHDDLDLPFGKIRYSHNSGAAGHNGVDSIIQQLGSQMFTRLRFGIAKDQQFENSESFVLKDISKQQQTELPKFLNSFIESINFFVANDFAKTATKFNQQPK